MKIEVRVFSLYIYLCVSLELAPYFMTLHCLLRSSQPFSFAISAHMTQEDGDDVTIGGKSDAGIFLYCINYKACIPALPPVSPSGAIRKASVDEKVFYLYFFHSLKALPKRGSGIKLASLPRYASCI